MTLHNFQPKRSCRLRWRRRAARKLTSADSIRRCRSCGTRWSTATTPWCTGGHSRSTKKQKQSRNVPSYIGKTKKK